MMSPSRSNVICCVPQCTSRTDRKRNISLHVPPKCMVKKWEVAIRTGKKLSPCMKVCSLHFKDDDFFAMKPAAATIASSDAATSGEDPTVFVE